MAFGQDDDDYSGKPVEEGKTYEVNIDDVGSKGDGIARVEGFVVFVPETDIGERVEVEINSVGRKFAFGEVTERLGEAEDVADDLEEEPAEDAEAEEEDEDELFEEEDDAASQEGEAAEDPAEVAEEAAEEAEPDADADEVEDVVEEESVEDQLEDVNDLDEEL